MCANPLIQTILAALIKSWGFTPLTTDEVYLKSTLTYRQATFQNKATDPFILTMESETGNKIQFWNFLLEKIGRNDDWCEEFHLSKDLFINDQGYVISLSNLTTKSLSSFEIYNVFTRQAINSVDERVDLGDLVFIVSNSGILFHTYSFVKHKAINDHPHFLKLFWDDGSIQSRHHLVLKQKKIGPYGDPFDIPIIDIIPRSR